MDEIFVERIVKRKIDIKGMLLRVLAVVLTVLSLCTILFLGMLGVTLTILFAYLTYLVWAYTSVEYEYSFLNTELTIEKIMGQRKRKHVDEFDIKQNLLPPLHYFYSHLSASLPLNSKSTPVYSPSYSRKKN